MAQADAHDAEPGPVGALEEGHLGGHPGVALVDILGAAEGWGVRVGEFADRLVRALATHSDGSGQLGALRVPCDERVRPQLPDGRKDLPKGAAEAE